MKMIPWKIFFLGIFLMKVDGQQSPTTPMEIFVAFSTRKPFAYRSQSGAVKGLDFLIIENFARRINANVKYIEYNISFNGLFRKEETYTDLVLNRNLK